MDISELGSVENCMFSDDEEVIEKGKKCPICVKSSGDAGDFMCHIRQLHDQLLCSLNREAIYDILYQCYETDYRQAMAAGGEKAQTLSRADIQTHFEKHENTPLSDVVYDLRTLQMIQVELRKKGIRSRHSLTGETNIDTSKVKLFLELSKQKLALHRSLKKIKQDMPKNSIIQPRSFFKQEW